MPTQSTQPHVGSPLPGFAQRHARALIGWLPINDGALWLAGRQLNQQPNPRHIALGEAARLIVAARAPGIDQAGVVADLPGEAEAHITALNADPVGAQVLAEAGLPKLVDLSRVCAARPQILTEDASRRVEGISAGDFARLAHVTLPPPTPPQIPLAFDPIKNSWIVSSPNPNLRVVGHFNTTVAAGRNVPFISRPVDHAARP